jgi:hypothetical protein
LLAALLLSVKYSVGIVLVLIIDGMVFELTSLFLNSLKPKSSILSMTFIQGITFPFSSLQTGGSANTNTVNVNKVIYKNN